MEQPASMRHDDEGPMNDSDALLPGHIQRANIWRLAIAQALAGANAVAVYAAGAIIGSQLAPSPMLATLPISVFVVGMAVCILPAGAIARRHGRRAAFLAGTAAGVVAGLLAMLAVIVGGFWLFCLATFFGGAYAAVVLSFRFAATDGVAPAQRARALSLVMAGGVAAGVVVVKATPGELRQVEQYLKAVQLSIERQVMLEAKIVEVSLSKDAQTGINWGAFGKLGSGQHDAGQQVAGRAAAQGRAHAIVDLGPGVRRAGRQEGEHGVQPELVQFGGDRNHGIGSAVRLSATAARKFCW